MYLAAAGEIMKDLKLSLDCPGLVSCVCPRGYAQKAVSGGLLLQSGKQKVRK